MQAVRNIDLCFYQMICTDKMNYHNFYLWLNLLYAFMNMKCNYMMKYICPQFLSFNQLEVNVLGRGEIGGDK